MIWKHDFSQLFRWIFPSALHGRNSMRGGRLDWRTQRSQHCRQWHQRYKCCWICASSYCQYWRVHRVTIRCGRCEFSNDYSLIFLQGNGRSISYPVPSLCICLELTHSCWLVPLYGFYAPVGQGPPVYYCYICINPSPSIYIICYPSS